MNIFLLTCYTVHASDHPIHPPPSASDPFECEFPPNLGYKLQMVNGVMRIYESAGALERNEPMKFRYMDFYSFLNDHNMLQNLLADGPL